MVDAALASDLHLHCPLAAGPQTLFQSPSEEGHCGMPHWTSSFVTYHIMRLKPLLTILKQKLYTCTLVELRMLLNDSAL